MRKGSSQFEYDVFLARITSVSPPAGMDVTINWRALEIENKGVFYTDSNAYKIIKRDVYKKREYAIDARLKDVAVPLYFFPVNSAIFIESTTEKK